MTIPVLYGTAARWALLNPIVDLGKPGWESDTGVFKIGDGATRWATLPAVSGGGGGGGGASWGTITGTLSSQADLNSALAGKAATSHTHLAAAVTDFATAADARVAAGITGKADLAGPVFTGNPRAPTPSPGDNDTSIATTAFVTAAGAVLLKAGSATITVPNGRREHEQVITATGVTAASRVMIALQAGADSDENTADMLDLVTIAGIPGTDQITVQATFSGPTGGPILTYWSAM
jgi:hypothetical protein